MKVFVYQWQTLSENPVIIRGHSLDEDNKYCFFDVNDFKLISFVEKGQGEEVFMETSENIYETKKFIKMHSINKSELKGHMAELNTLSMFTSIKHLDYACWIEDGLVMSKDQSIHPNPVIMCFDIEVSKPLSFHGMPVPYEKDHKIEMISCVYWNYMSDQYTKILFHINSYKINELKDVKIIPCDTELHLIDQFFENIKRHDPIVITGFNIYGFDFDYIISRLQHFQHYTKPCGNPFNSPFTIKQTNWESSAYGYNNYQKIKIDGRVVFDMMLYFKRFKLEKYSLDVISKEFLGEGKDDMPYEEMFECFAKKENLERVALYCIQDSLLVMRLFNKFNIWNELCETSRIMRCDMEDIYTRGEQLKVTNQIIKECIDRNIILVKRPTEAQRNYGGATVLDPVIGIHNNCAVLDFQSLYPSIIIAFNICPSTVHRHFNKSVKGLFPHCIKNLLDERKRVKNEMKELTGINYVIMNKRQNALKVCANSMYGIMGFASNPYFGSIECAEKITFIGRQVLLSTIEYISSIENIQVIYGDTDSCMIKFPKNITREKVIELSGFICEEVTANLPFPMALQFEEYYKKMILMKKKRYIMVKSDGTLKYKGVMIARRGYCEFAKDIYKNTIKMICEEKTLDEIKEYIDNMMTSLSFKEVSIDKLKITKSVKDVESYKTDVPQVIMAKRLIKEGHSIPAGTRLEYVFVKNDSKKQGEKMYTVEECEKNNLIIDHRYYAEKQISMQTDELLELVGLNKYIKNWYF